MSQSKLNTPQYSRQYSRLFAVDPSLTASGWALFSLQRDQLIAAGVLSPPPPSVLLAERLNQLQRSVTELLTGFGVGPSDLLICEGPAPLVDNPQSAIKVEHVRGIFEGVARSLGMQVPGRLHPRTVQSEVLGLRGRQLPRKEVKATAQEVALRLYPEEVKQLAAGRRGRVPQDIIDAILIGAAAVTRVQRCLTTGEGIQEVFVVGSRRPRRSAGGWSEKDLLTVKESVRDASAGDASAGDGSAGDSSAPTAPKARGGIRK